MKCLTAYDLIYNIEGDIIPIGETVHDNKSRLNLYSWCEINTKVICELIKCADGRAGRHQASVEEVSDYARTHLKKMYEWIGSCIDEWEEKDKYNSDMADVIKFLRVADFVIKFEINGQKFFIKDRGGEGEYNVSLYKFVASPTGKYETEFLKSVNEPFMLSEYGVPSKAGATLNEIDKKKFIEKCVSLGFTNYFCNEQ